MYYNTSIDNSLFEFTKRPRRSKPDAHSHLLVWTYSERRVGLNATRAFLWVSQRQHHLTDINSNNTKNYRVTPMIESLRTTQIALGSQRLVGFSGGAETRYKKYPCKGSCERKSYETIVRTSFLGTRPSCPPSPWWRFFDTDDRKPNLWLGPTGSPVITRKIRSTESKCTLKNLKLLKVFSCTTVSPG